MPEKSLKELGDEVKKAKLEKELKKLKPGKKDKQVTRIEKPKLDGEKKEIGELMKRRAEAIKKSDAILREQKGFFKRTGTKLKATLAIAGLNKAIFEQKRILKQRTQLKRLRLQGELEEEKEKLRKLKEKGRVRLSMDDITKPIQPIKTEDIFG